MMQSIDCPRCVVSSAEIEQLREALTTRDLIGQAKGILMERHRVSADGAFQLLVEISQRDNLKLREVAATVVGFDGFDGSAT